MTGNVSELATDQEALLQVVAGLSPASAAQIGAALGKLSNILQDLTDQLSEADEEATAVTEEHELAYDQAYLLAVSELEKAGKRPTDTMCSAKARVETAGLRLKMQVAKLRVRQLRQAHKTLDRRIDVGRTQAATVRSEHRTIGYGGAA